MSWPTLCAAASVKFSGGASAAVDVRSLIYFTLRRADGRIGSICGRLAAFATRGAFALVNQLAVDFGADRHLDQLVLYVADHARLRPELDALRRPHVAFDRAVQQHVRHDDRPLDATALADAEHGPCRPSPLGRCP